MKVKRLILCLLAMIGINLASKADTYFPYPIVPDSISSLQGRCDYLARHFWDFCDLKKAFSSRQKVADEFAVYISILRNASADSAINSVTRFTKQLEKQPKELVFIAECAENLLYGDSAEMWIDALYLPFAEAVANNKKVEKTDRARFANQATALGNSMIRKPMASIDFTSREGQKRKLVTDSAQMTVIYFNNPTATDSNMARLRLDADIALNTLINKGLAKVVTISVCAPDDAWKSAVSAWPAGWTVGAQPEAENLVDLRSGTPDFYILDAKGNIRFKHITLDQVLDIARQMNQISAKS